MWKNLPILEFKVLHTWGNIIRVFVPFISFFSINWTRPTLQLLNKALLEVLLIESTHLALMIFSLELRRKIAQDYQALLADILKRQISQILKWPKFFSKTPNTHFVCSQQKITLKRTNFQILKIFQIFKLEIFPFLAYSQHVWSPSISFLWLSLKT